MPKTRRPTKSNQNDWATAKDTAPTNMRTNPNSPARRGDQRSTANPTGTARATAGKLMAPMRSPIWKWERAKRSTSSGINGGTTKNVAPMAKKLKTDAKRTSQRREARTDVDVIKA